MDITIRSSTRSGCSHWRRGMTISWFNEITIKLLDSGCDSHKEIDRQIMICLFSNLSTHFRYFCPFFTISISILISIFHFVSISRSISIFWISRFQDQYQYQYLGKSNFEINIKINMTNILKNIGKSIYCPIPGIYTTIQWVCKFIVRALL